MGNTPLILVVVHRKPGMAQLLLEYKANHEATDLNKWTALMVASTNGYDSIVKILLEYKADIEAAIYAGYTALH